MSAQPPKPVIPNPRVSGGVRDLLFGFRDGLIVDDNRARMILNQQHEVRVARRPLESFLRRVKRELGLKQSGVTVCLVSDKAMARLNQSFRKKKGPTDVLSFPAVARKGPVRLRHKSNTSSASHEYLGDIAISPATARRYAKNNGRHLASELRVLILHGVLHLLGYDHETDRGEMDAMEQRLRKRFGLT